MIRIRKLLSFSALLVTLLCYSASDASQPKTPAALSQCITQLKQTLSPATINALKHSASEKELLDYHLTLGTLIRNKWIRNKQDSALVKYFTSAGVSSPDEMTSIILTTLWRDLHNAPLKLEEQIQEARVAESYSSPQVTQKRSVSQKIWTRELALSDGTKLKLMNLKGKVIVLLLAFRDYHSINAVKALNAARLKYSAKQLAIVGVLNCKFSPNATVSEEVQQSFLKSANPEFPFVLDPPFDFVSVDIKNALVSPGSMSLPELILIGKDGYMISRFRNWSGDTEGSLSKAISTALKEPK